jgi:hypothetical protein
MRSLPLVFLVLASCGDDSARKIADAPEGPHDSPPLIDTPPQALPVLVTAVLPDGTPIPGAKVYFQNADSSVAGATALDASGNARLVMNPGGYATVLAPNVLLGGFGGGMQYTVTTWSGVKPGDHLIFSLPGGGGAPTQATITIPLDTAHSAAITKYIIESTCGQTDVQLPSGSGATNASTTFYFASDCTAADMFVVGVDASSQPVSSFFVPAQPVTANEVIDYTAQTYAAAGTRTYTFNNVTGGSIEVSDNVATGRGTLYTGIGASTPSADPATLTAPYPAQAAGSLDVIFASQLGSLTRRMLAEWGTTGAYTQDWAAHLLPDFATAPSFDTGTHVLSWTTSGGALTPDFAEATVLVFRGAMTWSWQIVAPSGTQIAFPNLPTDVADLNIAATDTYNFASGDAVHIAKVPGGYDAARGSLFVANSPVFTGATGTAEANTYQQLLSVAAKHNAAKRDVMRRWIRPR